MKKREKKRRKKGRRRVRVGGKASDPYIDLYLPKLPRDGVK